MKILVTGSRDFEDNQFVYDTLDAFAPARPITLIHGACATGADYYAHEWANFARNQHRVYEVAIPAKWEHLPRQMAGPQRNGILVGLCPDIVLAFHWKGAANRGTSNCVKQAKAVNIKVKEYERGMVE